MKKRIKNVLLGLVWAFAVCLLVSLCTGCASRRVVTGETSVSVDTVYKVRLVQDTVRTKDSVWVETYTRGDTVYRVKESVRWRDRASVRVDTVYRAALRADTIRVPVPVERKATWWERTVEEPLKQVAVVVCLASLALVFVRLWQMRGSKDKD